MATAVAQPSTTFDPYSVGLGAEAGVPTFYFAEIPFGIILRAQRTAGCVYAVYTTEHTTDDFLDEIWAELPHRGLCYYTCLRCRKVPPYLAGQAEDCFIHYYATHERGLLAGITKTQFLSTQRILGLF